MKQKLKDDKFVKDLLFKFISVLVITSIALLLLNVLSQNKDGRMQIVDEDGGTEYLDEAKVTREESRLAEILSSIKGVGEVEVMITYKHTDVVQSVFTKNEESEEIKVRGVIVTAKGAGNPVIKNNIFNAVSSVFDIPIQNVMVFEMKKEGYK